MSRTLRHLRARLALVRPGAGAGSRLSLVRRDRLPAEVREALDTPALLLEPYAELARAWHEHVRTSSPDYASYVRFLVRERHIGSTSALDLACGTGVTAESIVPMFAHVRGLDASASMLAHARARLGHLPNVEWVEGDFRDFTCERSSFELVTCSGDSLNYAQTVAQLRSAFACVARVLSPRGVFLFDLQSEPSAAANEIVLRWDGPAGVWYQVQCYDPSTRIDDACVVWPAGVERHRRRIFTRREVDQAAKDAGLVHADRFDGPLVRWLGRPGMREFYSLRRA